MEKKALYCRAVLICCAASLLALTAGCAGVVARNLSDGIAAGIVNQDDMGLAREGMPAYLIMIDGLIAETPGDEKLLRAGARLYSAYAGVFVDEPQRAQRLAAKAKGYGRRAMCVRNQAFCGGEAPRYERFAALLDDMDRADLATLYIYASAWAGWVQASSGDWQAVADLPRIEAMMERVVELDEGYDLGMPHVYLGVMRSQLPVAMGGRPERGRKHFERAIELSSGRNLVAKVEYARHYARLVFNRALHDRLLNEVMEADPEAAGLTLANTIARRQAQELLADSEDYFGE